ncbi:hypothetical protein UFOVP898_65 [uncultured Caudovirales phage]|uniref:Uncharacterized protein n=1 Tax=uncultured Caudovirales phage TaxID=2100421 RepID=A0A6J5PXY8_9CAUD|nr:hypothetical protein UFOVP898_65 [uncultured Caudovirales phage]CAB4176853.1 hypothetical protein UFOVP985_68 [uncultured Caudovirales phage]CAB4181796.1 hypothetical protein UFOVP1073_63 [uncultured Caudovirales phage]CAB4197717.1 hypothetical protein UFOVP1308_28 [uncultured Caudovirales phage]CAB4210712.1 hypothetical protein UFOVP1423_41 [uncultured Caudovirales phage]
MRTDRTKTELLALGIAVARWSPIIGGGVEGVEILERAVARIQYLEGRVLRLEKATEGTKPKTRGRKHR